MAPPSSSRKPSRWSSISRKAWQGVKKPWRIKNMKGLMGAALAIGIGAGAGKIAHTRYVHVNNARTAATYAQLAERSGKASRASVEELPWSVLHNTRNEAKRRNISTTQKEFDTLIDEAFAQRKKRDASERDPNRGGFASNPTIELIDTLMNLPKVEVENRLKQLYARDTTESKILYQHNLDRALKAKPELVRYFDERAARAVEAARKTNSAEEKKMYTQIARAAKKHSIKIGASAGGTTLLVYILLTAAIARRRQKK